MSDQEMSLSGSESSNDSDFSYFPSSLGFDSSNKLESMQRNQSASSSRLNSQRDRSRSPLDTKERKISHSQMQNRHVAFDHHTYKRDVSPTLMPMMGSQNMSERLQNQSEDSDIWDRRASTLDSRGIVGHRSRPPFDTKQRPISHLPMQDHRVPFDHRTYKRNFPPTLMPMMGNRTMSEGLLNQPRGRDNCNRRDSTLDIPGLSGHRSRSTLGTKQRQRSYSPMQNCHVPFDRQHCGRNASPTKMSMMGSRKMGGRLRNQTGYGRDIGSRCEKIGQRFSPYKFSGGKHKTPTCGRENARRRYSMARPMENSGIAVCCICGTKESCENEENSQIPFEKNTPQNNIE